MRCRRPPPTPAPVLPVIILAPSFFFFMLAVITSLGAGSLEDALARADEADALERRVAERTAALTESRERLHFALKGADLGAWSYDIGSPARPRSRRSAAGCSGCRRTRRSCARTTSCT